MVIDIKKILRLKLEIGMTISTFCKRFLNFHVEDNWNKTVDAGLGFAREIFMDGGCGCSGNFSLWNSKWKRDFLRTLIKNKIIKGEINDFMKSAILDRKQANKANKILKECLKAVKW